MFHHFLFLNHTDQWLLELLNATQMIFTHSHTHFWERERERGNKPLLIAALSHTHSYYFTARHIKICLTHAGRRTQRESAPRSWLSHRPHCPAARERPEWAALSFVWAKWWMRWRDVMTWLIAQTLNEKQHSSDGSLSLFQRDPTSPANPARKTLLLTPS